MDHTVTAITELPHILQRDAAQTRMLYRQIPFFRGSQHKLNEFEHLLLNHLRPHQNHIIEKNKFHFFQSLLCEKAIDFWPTLLASPETTLKFVLDKYR